MRISYASACFLLLLMLGLAAPAAAQGAGTGISNSVVAAKLLKGFAVTLEVAGLSLVLGFCLSIPGALILHSGSLFPRLLLRAAVDFIRGTPLLIQLFVVYYGLPAVSVDLGAMGSAIFTLTINAAAYMSEVVRSGLMAVEPEQRMAARALGLGRWQVFRFVVWPQAFRVAIPPLMNSAVALMKDTALVSVITVSEVVMEARNVISVTFEPMKYYLIVAAMFFVVTYPLMLLAGRLERRIKERGFAHA